MRVGKTAASKFLYHNKGATIESFARPIKETLRLIFGLSHEEMSDANKEKVVERFGKTPREMQRVIGKNTRDFFGNDIYVKLLNYRLQAAHSLYLNIAIDDLRFPEEAAWVRSVGGYLIKINREAAPQSNHQSETSLDGWTDWDLIIDNNDQLVDLHIKIDNFYMTVIGKVKEEIEQQGRRNARNK